MIDIQYQFATFAAKMHDMNINLSTKVKELCRIQGITLKNLSQRIGIAPESLSRTLSGNPQLSTLEAIASNLNVNLYDLFSSSPTNSLHSIIVHDNITYITDDLNSLINNVKAICAKEGVEP